MTDQTDHLAAAVMRALSRSFMRHFSIRPGRAFGLGLVTFGIWPIAKLSRQFRDYVTFEKQQLWHLAEWLRLRRGGDDALALHDDLKSIQPNGALRVLPMLCAAITCYLVFVQLSGHFSVNRLIHETWQLRRPWFGGGAPDSSWKFWIVGLSVAYLLHVLRVALHHFAMRRFVERLNRLLAREQIPPVVMPAMGTGMSIGWWAAGLGLSAFGGLWGIPMALAAAMHRQYISSTAITIRAEMLASVRAMLQQNRPAVAVPNYVIHGLRCANPLCRAGLRVGAGFCTRCGQSTSRHMSEVA